MFSCYLDCVDRLAIHRVIEKKKIKTCNYLDHPPPGKKTPKNECFPLAYYSGRSVKGNCEG